MTKSVILFNGVESENGLLRIDQDIKTSLKIENKIFFNTNEKSWK